MNGAIWWVGVVTIGVGTLGALAMLITWALDTTIKLAGFSKALLQAYARLQTEKMHERQIAALLALQLTCESNKYSSGLSLNHATHLVPTVPSPLPSLRARSWDKSGTCMRNVV